jgi:hypothetical protein
MYHLPLPHPSLQLDSYKPVANRARFCADDICIQSLLPPTHFQSSKAMPATYICVPHIALMHSMNAQPPHPTFPRMCDSYARCRPLRVKGASNLDWIVQLGPSRCVEASSNGTTTHLWGCLLKENAGDTHGGWGPTGEHGAFCIPVHLCVGMSRAGRWDGSCPHAHMPTAKGHGPVMGRELEMRVLKPKKPSSPRPVSVCLRTFYFIPQ